MAQNVAVPPTTPLPEQRAPAPQRVQRLRHSQGGKAGGEAGLLMPTKTVAVFRSGSWSCGRNTDIPGAGRTADLAVRALLSNRSEPDPS